MERQHPCNAKVEISTPERQCSYHPTWPGGKIEMGSDFDGPISSQSKTQQRAEEEQRAPDAGDPNDPTNKSEHAGRNGPMEIVDPGEAVPAASVFQFGTPRHAGQDGHDQKADPGKRETVVEAATAAVAAAGVAICGQPLGVGRSFSRHAPAVSSGQRRDQSLSLMPLGPAAAGILCHLPFAICHSQSVRPSVPSAPTNFIPDQRRGLLPHPPIHFGERLHVA